MIGIRQGKNRDSPFRHAAGVAHLSLRFFALCVLCPLFRWNVARCCLHWSDAGHVIVFFEDGADVWLYDTTFLGGPWQNVYGSAVLPEGIMEGAANATFRSSYYDTAVRYHRGTIGYTDGAGNPQHDEFTVRTTRIPPNEIRLFWSRD